MIQRVLITGGTGFVGKHLQEELERRGVGFFVFSRSEFDLTDRAAAEAVFRQNSDADAILHLAAYQAAGRFPATHAAEQLDINSRIHLNVLEAWRKHLPKAKLVAVGSSCLYPDQAGPIGEDRIMDGQVHGSVWAYALTRRLLYGGIRAGNERYDLDGSYIIPATMFGEHDDFHAETAHVCGALIGKFVGAVMENRPTVEIWGDGTQVRDFQYVKDFVAALLHVLPMCRRDVINLGPGRGISIRELAGMIRDASGFTGRMVFQPTQYVGVKEKYIDATKLKEKYGWRIEGELAEPIRRTVQWYGQNYSVLRDRRKFPEPAGNIAK